MEPKGSGLLLKEELNSAHDAFVQADIRELNPLQMAYVGDTVHDLYVRSMLLSRGMAVGKMHRQAVRMVSAGAQARMLEHIEPELTPEEADIARRGRNSQAKHAAPRHADPADYAHATALEALWGYLYLSGRTKRLDELMKLALTRTEDVWEKRN